MEFLKRIESRDPAEVLPEKVPSPLEYVSNRDFVRDVLKREVTLRASGTQIVPLEQESTASFEYRNHMNSEGSPSRIASAGYIWTPGGELTRKVA